MTTARTTPPQRTATGINRRSLAAAALLLPLVACAPRACASEESLQSSQHHDFKLVTVVEGLENPWALAFLPDGGMLVTEKPGRLRMVRDGKLLPEAVAGLPEITVVGQGGLLDVALHPDFARNRWVYLSYAAEGEGGYGTRVSRGKLDGMHLTEVETIFRSAPLSRGGRHFGSRLLFDEAGMLYVTVGDRGDRANPQDLGRLNGKVLRIHDDGRVPDDNPFVGSDDAKAEVFSLGHRNQQGLALQPGTGLIWATEHGPRGGDELNVVRAGVNYGWPVITYGEEYAGGKIGRGTEFPGLAQPVTYWVPSISPSGLAFYDAEAFPKWRGDLFVGALSAEHLERIKLDGERVVEQERLLEDFEERIRDVRQGPDGLIYILTATSDGGIYRLEPAS